MEMAQNGRLTSQQVERRVDRPVGRSMKEKRPGGRNSALLDIAWHIWEVKVRRSHRSSNWAGRIAASTGVPQMNSVGAKKPDSKIKDKDHFKPPRERLSCFSYG